MKGKQIFYWLSLLLCLAVAGCSSDGEDEVTPKDEPGEEGGGEQTGREVWSFDVCSTGRLLNLTVLPQTL